MLIINKNSDIMRRKISIVLCMGFGDEGKGLTVNKLSELRQKPLVVRFNGGHQVGHTVVHDGNRHVFGNFGSGSLQGVPTYWSEYCTVDPIGVDNERIVLEEQGINPMVYYNSNVMVTTPYDIFANTVDADNVKHGSVGVGFGKTIQRNEDHFHLYVRDLLYPEIRDEKLRLIGGVYYGLSDRVMAQMEDKIAKFKEACDLLAGYMEIVNSLGDIYREYDHLIFEGGQGIMLDMDYGFFPNVTRSNTTSKNAMEIINGLDYDDLHTYYITRAYQTRHGNGHMTNSDMDVSYITENPNETNVYGEYQGDFRKSVLDLDLLKYAIDCDSKHNKSTKHLVITCLDQVPLQFPMTWMDTPIMGGSREIGWSLGFKSERVHTSYSDTGDKLFGN